MGNISGTQGNDTINGTAGDDAIYAGRGDDIVYGGAGNDTIDAGQPILPGNHDILYGEDGDDRLIIYPADGSRVDPYSVADGGSGTDTAELRFGNFGSPLTYVHNSTYAEVHCGRVAAVLKSIEALVFIAGTGNDIITGGDYGDQILGGAGDDILDGAGGTDVLIGGAGNNRLYGGAGSDILASGPDGNDIIDGGADMDFVDIGYSWSQSYGAKIDLRQTIQTFGSRTLQFTSIEGALGTAYNDVLIGTEGDNLLSGREGSDVLYGLGGNDTLAGGRSFGIDYLYGGAGQDTAAFADSKFHATITRFVNGTIRVSTPEDGVELLRGIETLTFSDATVQISALARADVNNDGDSDIVYYSASAGTIGKFAMDGGIRQDSGSYLGDMGSGAWDIAATGHISNGARQSNDGSADLVLKNAASGQFYVWTVENGVQVGGSNLGVIGTNWDVRSTGDFDADGVSDLLWRDASNGHAYIWTMTSALNQKGAVSLGVLGTEWDLGQAGDFDGDGDSDVLLRNANNGQLYVYSMQNAAVSGGRSLAVLGTDWTLAGTGDFNGDGRSDIALKNGTTGQFYVYQMNPDMGYEGKNLGTLGTSWNIAATGDYNADGTDDILWRNDATGQVYLWQMDQGQQAATGSSHIGYMNSDLVIV